MARTTANQRKESAKQTEIAVRRRSVIQYRLLGCSYQSIGDKLGISFVQARADEMAARAEAELETRQAVEEMRMLENERLDMAMLAISGAVVKGHLGAIDRWIRISERRSKLNGLDKPVQFEDVTPPARRNLSNLSITELQLFEMLLQKVEGPSEDENDEELNLLG